MAPGTALRSTQSAPSTVIDGLAECKSARSKIEPLSLYVNGGVKVGRVGGGLLSIGD